MKSIILFSLLTLMAFNNTTAQVAGVWYNVDDKDGKPKSHIQITEKNGKLEAKVLKLLPSATVTHCKSCTGENKGKPIEGMQIMWGLKKSSSTLYEDGEIMDPGTGKVYSCFVELESKDKLKVRGYIGVSVMGRSQYWYRVK